MRAPDTRNLGADSGDTDFPAIQDKPAQSQSHARGPFSAQPPSPVGWDEAKEAEDEEEDAWADEMEKDEVDDDDESLDLEIIDEDIESAVAASIPREARGESRSSHVALPVVKSRGWDDVKSDEEEDEEAPFTLVRGSALTVEELDLAPMVDVALQLVLFFMVTATTVLYKTLEIPKPTTEAPPSAVAQGRSRTLEDFKDDYILVEIDAEGAMKIDREPVRADMNTLVERLRTAREKTGRKAMLLSADFATRHRHSVLAYDAANEIGLGIVIARPESPQGPGPSLVPGQPAPARGPARPAASRPTNAAVPPN
jgi:biopolymer transport protein ExbD